MSGTQPKDINAKERQHLALELRKAGHTFETIAAKCGFKDRSGAYKTVKNALQHYNDEPVAQLRALEAARLDQLLTVFVPKMLKGDIGSAHVVLKTIETRARLYGLNVDPESNAEQIKTIIRMIPSDYMPDLLPMPQEANGSTNGNGHSQPVV
jgi:hypothetical protein